MMEKWGTVWNIDKEEVEELANKISLEAFGSQVSNSSWIFDAYSPRGIGDAFGFEFRSGLPKTWGRRNVSW